MLNRFQKLLLKITKNKLLIIAILFIEPIYFLNDYRYDLTTYYIFSLIFNIFIFLSIIHKTYFMVYMAFFLSMGFYFKFIYFNYYKLSNFFEPVANFSFTNWEFNNVLSYISICILGLIIGGYFGRIINFNRKEKIKLSIHIKNHNLIIYVVIVFLVCLFNFYFSIYQRAGLENSDSLLNKIIIWLLFMGFTGVILIIAQLQKKINLNKTFYFILLAEFFIQVSTLSRGYILTSSAILFSLAIFQIKNYIFNIKKYSLLVLVSLILFIASIYIVNIIRIIKYNTLSSSVTAELIANDPSVKNITNVAGLQSNLILGRWTGIEGLMSIMGYDRKGWELMQSALLEKRDYSKTSFYDRVILGEKSQYFINGFYYGINLPGIIGFLTYAGSLWLTFTALFFLAFFSVLLERYIISYGYEFLASFISLLISYRLVSFGYAPLDSYKIILGILLLLIIMKLLESRTIFFRVSRFLN